jgi:hypothetical protein
MLCHMLSPFKNHNKEKSGNMTSSYIDASLKTFVRNRIGKTHNAKKCNMMCEHVIIQE